MIDITPEQRRLQRELWATMPPQDFTVEIQLDVDAAAGEPARVAYDWVDHLTTTLAGDERARLAGLPASTRAAASTLRPGDEYGEITVGRFTDGRYRSRRRTLSDKGLDWLRKELSDMPHQVHAAIGLLDEHGRLTVGPLSVSIKPFGHSPGWLQLSAYVRESRFDQATQDRWIAALFAFADRVDPGYGQAGYHLDDGRTAVEETADWRSSGKSRRSPDHTIGRRRETLRGYDWITVVPRELAGAVGGAAALAETGAFADVRELARGGVVLRATTDFRDYSVGAAEPVFRALAAILPPGMPLLVERAPNVPPLFVVAQDPADL